MPGIHGYISKSAVDNGVDTTTWKLYNNTWTGIKKSPAYKNHVEDQAPPLINDDIDKIRNMNLYNSDGMIDKNLLWRRHLADIQLECFLRGFSAHNILWGNCYVTNGVIDGEYFEKPILVV